ncbi:MAG: molybdopterin converting factor subunit 1 [Thiobacillus sp. 63-78]|uniref:molybdopterin converting factor subunit 1 n=1 Tax=Thiobacillus sp. 63-78 TaxID=1895859 RepID=UPI00086BA561|nr:molybdopterin converting factor subunit 1 [Thiobacillus sp. 63-78]MBN8762121.1 molybdopterin converting factor subunit 1 [Thiobacillus sp.]MBN8765355.1 molybdopterin converting factor subunit 1 [Thiobacillus sp.]ODV14212.1 MAG: molybdopterin converting factor subunit 1 [Thiobacillus sp. SCN 64-317]OJZ13802.1 MAG: molybdopterin converting factor subunit 1 [Thiobacillus sp. 63-78]
MTLRILYFARLRERFGQHEETLDFAGSTAADLIAQLRARGGVWAEELAAGRAFRVAVNQNLVAFDAALTENAEVAIFPPVTGG